MDSIDFVVLRSLYEWRLQKRHASLVTVVETWGSSPRPVGSIMAMREDGVVVGSVSGGCIEDDLIHRYRNTGHTGKPEILTYGVTADEAHQFGLPCGGTIKLVIEFDPDPQLLGRVIEATQQGKLAIRKVCLTAGEVELIATDMPESLTFDGIVMSSVFGPHYRMLVIGAGQLSEYLAIMARFNGFSVTVCDPRIEFSQVWSLQDVNVSTGMPDDVVDEFKPDSRTCIVAVTHDPKLDDLALLSALHTDAFYVGAIGSRKNNAARRQRMIDYLDQPPELMDKLRGPVGIYIGSKTPAEIAVSIMAEIIAVKNGIDLPSQYQVAIGKKNMERTK